MESVESSKKYSVWVKGKNQLHVIESWLEDCTRLIECHESQSLDMTIATVESDWDLTMVLNNWLCDSMVQPYPTGSLLYWYPLQPEKL